ncbi:uncharacterized protein LOC127862608 isoform X2 [Dreissena polymorpha]|uniref:uncharacterized protein LOC127862608 isoform X2 n=1 Tax=Dreissena polymorpha TaxID=45954 RepID=UPI0022656B15|nr:uncharacterized protein LOC127862608 isoform X2 [Dreissena polymorpha]
MSFPEYSTSESEFKWSTTSYRLDELGRRFKFPRVVRLAEGYCSDIEAEGFSKDDIIGIDNVLTIEKVAAHFANRKGGVTSIGDDERSYERLSEDILVPLNYKGKVKIRNQGIKYSTVRELVEDFPRFAKVCKNLSAIGADDRPLHILAGTTIELVQVVAGRDNQPGELVVQFQIQEKPVYAKVSILEAGLFRAESDDAEYTIKEVVDRFKLPQVVKFIDDEIRKVYTKDILEGIGNMRTITETLQLNRVVSQSVLVGHYKPVEGYGQTDTEKVKKRTLVVLPMDHPEIREIEVNVLEDDGDISDIYERVFNVCNISNSLDVVDTIYVEFSKDTPTPKIFKLDDAAHANTTGRRQLDQASGPLPVSKPPKPLPPSPGVVDGTLSPSNSTQAPLARGKQPSPQANKPASLSLSPPSKLPEESSSQTDYEIMSPSPISSSQKGQQTTQRATAFSNFPQTPQTPKTPTTPQFSRTKALPPEPQSSAPRKMPQNRAIKPAIRPDLPNDPAKQSEYERLDDAIVPASLPPDLPPSLPPHRPRKNPPAPVPEKTDINMYENRKPANGVGQKTDADGGRSGQADYEDMEPGIPVQRAPSPPQDDNDSSDYLKPTPRVDALPIKIEKFKKWRPGIFQRKKIENQYTPEPKKPLPVAPPAVIKEIPSSKVVPPTVSRTAVVKPMTPYSPAAVTDTPKEQLKSFLELNCNELVERLQLCRMLDMAKACETEGLDGSFFANMDNESLIQVFKLNTMTLLKFKKMRDENWVPNE